MMRVKPLKPHLQILLLSLLLLNSQLEARVTRIQIRSRDLLLNGLAFGPVGAYEKIQGRVFFEVDPADRRNAVVFDVDKAPRNSRGAVEFSADFYILKPVDAAKANGTLLFEVSNRGRKLGFARLNDSPVISNDPTTPLDIGNQFSLLQGYTFAWVGWAADVAPGANRLTVQLPIALQDGKPIAERIIAEFPDGDEAGGIPFSRPLGYEAVSTDQAVAMAELRKRPSDSPRPSGPEIPEGEIVPTSQWSFARCPNGPPGTPSPTDVCLSGGFQTNIVYQLVYKATNSPVAGLGYATTRDFISFLRNLKSDDTGTANPVGSIASTLCMGFSQTAFYLRDFVHQGFNEDEQGGRVCDGVFLFNSSAKKLPLNYRFSTRGRFTSFQHHSRYLPDSEFPTRYDVRENPVTGIRDGILKRPATDPKIMHMASSADYWHHRASLVDTDEGGRLDLTSPANVRSYLFSSLEHSSPGTSTFGIGNRQCQQLTNPVTAHILVRPLLLALDQWVRNGSEPPVNRIPRVDEGTLVAPDQASTGFPKIPGVTYNGLHNGSGQRDFGPRVVNNSGVVDNFIPRVLSTHRILVPKVDAIGNDVAGIRHPFVEAPVATLTGWNLRRAEFTDGDSCDDRGMLIPLARTRDDRLKAGDPRPSFEELYGDHAGYVQAVTKAAQKLKTERLMLDEDVDAIVQQARARAERSGVFFFAQAGGGGGFSTGINLTNPFISKSVGGTISFFGPDGRPVGGIVDSPDVPFTIPPSGTMTISTKSQGVVQSAYARVSSPDSVIATATYSLPGLVPVVVEPGTPAAFVWQAPVSRDVASAADAGVAVVNVSGTAVRVILSLVDSGGRVVMASTSLFLAPGEQLSRFLSELMPGLPGKFTGTLRVAAVSPLPSQSIVVTVVQFASGFFKAAPLTLLDNLVPWEEERVR